MGIGLALFGFVFGCASAGSGSSADLSAGRPGSVQEGMATYYAARLAGHRTANGERYDPAALTAAHPSLPFGTRVRVTRLGASSGSSSPSVVVRINDRCAGVKKIIDLSEAAARRLGMLRAGKVRVRLQVLSRAIAEDNP